MPFPYCFKDLFTHTMPFSCRDPATILPFSEIAPFHTGHCIWDWYPSDNKLPGTRSGKSPTCRHPATATLPRTCHEPAMALRGLFQKGIFVAWQGNGMVCVNPPYLHCPTHLHGFVTEGQFTRGQQRGKASEPVACCQLMPRVATNFPEIRGKATCLTSCQARQVNRRQFYFWCKLPTHTIHLSHVNSHNQYCATSRTVRIICFGCSGAVRVFGAKLVNVCERYLLWYLLRFTCSNLLVHLPCLSTGLV
jgi:hypothetical protein